MDTQMQKNADVELSYYGLLRHRTPSIAFPYQSNILYIEQAPENIRRLFWFIPPLSPAWQ